MKLKINEFSVLIGTVNGSGSATANNTIMKSIFKMGIPVSARNIFPSNIQGLPTWYSIRVSENGYLGRVDKYEIVVNLNQATIREDIDKLIPGGYLILDERIEVPENQDINVLKVPYKDILEITKAPQNLKVYLANMVYVGVLAALLKIDLTNIEETLRDHFNNVKKAIDPNMRIVNEAYNLFNKEEIKEFPINVKPRSLTSDYILTNGNKAAALGALYGGLQFSAWYPITPATELAETLNDFVPKLRNDPKTGNSTCVIVQAEDELAAVGMSIGAAWAGLRSMTSTSGPGLCLMSEYIGLAYQSEVPIVVWNVQRVGPSTGLPTRTSQGDLSFSYFLGHGDTEFVLMLPGSVNECFTFGWQALDIAEQIQTPVIVLSDLDLGMNNWVTKEFVYPDTDINRGKLIWEEDLENIIKDNQGKWGRYLDIDGDGITYRTVPGNTHEKAAYFARGTGHDELARYSEDPDVWIKEHQRLKMKVQQSVSITPEPILERSNQGKIGFISYGSSHFGTIEACDILSGKHEFKIDYLRILSIPFHESVKLYIENHEEVFVIEANRDGQMAQILMINYPDQAHKIKKLALLNGLSITASWIVKCFLEMEN